MGQNKMRVFVLKDCARVLSFNTKTSLTLPLIDES